MPQPAVSFNDLSTLFTDGLNPGPVELPKRKTSVGSILTSALKSGGLSALESGASDIWDDISGSDDDSSSSSKRSIISSIFKEVPTILNGIESLTDDDSSSSSKRSFISSLFKEVPTIINGIEGLTDSDGSSSSKRSWASLLDKAEPYIESGAESLAKTVGGAVGSEVVSAGQSLASDVGLRRRKVNWGNIIESGASAGASALGDGLGSVIASGAESLASDVGINIKERSTVIDAELPKRTGIWSDIESGIEDIAPIALSALSDVKRSDTIAAVPQQSDAWSKLQGVSTIPVNNGKLYPEVMDSFDDSALSNLKRSATVDAEMPKRSGIWTKIEHGLEDVAPIAIGALSDLKRSPTVDAEMPKRSGIWTTIEHGLEDVAPIAIGALSDLKRDAVPRSFLDDLESILGNLKNKRDTPEPRSFLDDLESILGNLKNKRDTVARRSFMDEFESIFGDL